MRERRQPAGCAPPAGQCHPACAVPGVRSKWRRGSCDADVGMSGAQGQMQGRVQESVQDNAQESVQNKVAVLIAGPTASGKSALALAVAERIGGIIVNTDSMQVYRDLAIITARPRAAETARAPHLLYGHVDAAENYSVGRFLRDAATALEAARVQRRVPIFTGGSGLYFKALIAGLAAIPPVPPDVRTAVRSRLEALGPAALHAELSRRDPVAAARLRPTDRTRVTRALEVVEATGRSIVEWQHDGMLPLLDVARVAKI